MPTERDIVLKRDGFTRSKKWVILQVEMAKKTAPVGFSEQIAAKVCGLISKGLSLRKIELREGMPTKSGRPELATPG